MKAKIATQKYNFDNTLFYKKKFFEREEEYTEFAGIDYEKINEVNNFALFWQQSPDFINSPSFLNRLNKTFFYANECLIGTFDEKALFLILALDPKLHMLRTYKLYSSNKDQLKTAFQQNFGVYSPKIIKLENSYAKRYLKLRENENQLMERKKNQL